MKILRNALFVGFGLALSMAAYGANAQEAEPQQEDTTKPRAVLFKIHEIKPVENTDGVVTHCDFLVTFYNRTTDSFRQAKVDMGWTDEVTERYVIADEEKKEEGNTRVVNRSASQRNNQVKLGEITTSVEMPALGSYKQATVKGSVKTEKCFLLLDNVNFNVESCSIIGQNDNNNQAGNSRRSRVANTRNTSACANLFQYVDSKNPEYYDEFKNISYSEQERLLNNEKAQDTTDIESTYENIVNNFEKADKIVSSIK